MKRLFDFSVSLIAVIILAIPMLIVALIVRITIGLPIVFTQKRPGLKGKPFYIYKFRTMTNATDEQGNLLPNGERITKAGQIIRKLSLDELPQLFNVLKNDISLVGPRPLLMEYLPLYSEEEARRHDVRPGITGWAQVNGRNTINWEERFKLDVWYVNNQSFFLDIKILFMTILKVFKSEGVNPEDKAFIEKFKGSSSNEKQKRKSNLIIIGGGSLGVMTLDTALEMNYYKDIYFVDDNKEKEELIHGFEVLGGMEEVKSLNSADFIIAIANNKVRKNIAEKFDLNYVNIIHPMVSISRFSQIGIGNIIMPNTSIDPETVIENHIIINKNNSLGHNVTMKNYTQVSPGCNLGGIINEGTFIGLGVNVLPEVIIGSWSTIGAGAVVTKNIPQNVTAVGIPAKILKE